MPSRPSHLFKIYSIDDDDDVWVTDKWRSKWFSQVRCSHCGSVRPSYVPRPVHAELQSQPARCVSLLCGGAGEVVRSDLLRFLRPYLPDAIIGRCTVRGYRAKSEKDRFYTIYVPRNRAILEFRGRNIPARRCKCQRVIPEAWRPRNFFLQESLDDRRVYLTEDGTIVLTPPVAAALRKKRMSDVGLEKIPVIKHPRKGLGWLVKGEPGWSALEEVTRAAASNAKANTPKTRAAKPARKKSASKGRSK